MSQPSFTHSFTRKTHKAPSAALDPNAASLSAKGKTVLVTAGATGIGLSVSTAFAQANVSNLILLSRREAVLATAAKELESTYPDTKVYVYPCDVTVLQRVQEVFKDVKNKIGEIDIIVSSHCPLQGAFPVAATSPELLLENFNGIVMGNVNLINTFLEIFPPSGPSAATEVDGVVDAGGREKIFINISSVATHVQIPHLSSYAAAKAALLTLLKHYDMEYSSQGLRIHCLHPGAHFTHAAQSFGVREDMMVWDDRSLPGRFVLWLCSDKARFLKGRFVHANWDVEELEGRKEEFEKDGELLKLGLVGCGGHELFAIGVS